ncbi:MAG: hypothetical protein U0354_09275 [Candidatus Sericytochromatia bacterium]
MRETITIEKVNFNIRTQALLNFTPITFQIKNKTPKPPELIQKEYWSEDAHRSLGKNFITSVDKDGHLWEIKILNFPKEYERIFQIIEINPQFIPQQFNVLEAGLVGVMFFNVLNWVHGKHIMPRKMQERSTYSG